jgi:hypothetical protein
MDSRRKLSLIAWAALLATAPPDSPPALRAAQEEPKPAEIRGTLHAPPGTTIERIVAVDRAWADVLKTSAADAGLGKDPFVYPAKLEAEGRFLVGGLLQGRAYDLIVWTRDAVAGAPAPLVRWEGASMDYHRGIQPASPATADDRKSIEALITDPPQFYDKVRTLRIAADHQHATVLVELVRTRDFHSAAPGGGELIYRVELWYFENLFGGWAKDRNTEKVLARLRGAPAALPPVWQFVPELGGLLPDGKPLDLQLPAKPDPRHGLVGGIK